MNKFSEAKIIASWKKNVKPWITAIRDKEIHSRVLITNAAVIHAILKRQPKSMLDIGCGEGWLVRELQNAGVQSTGIDAVPGLIDYAKQVGEGNFLLLPYEQVSPLKFDRRFDAVVCNFSLLGHTSVNRLLAQIPELLSHSGVLIIQTLHPVSTCGDEKYEDGWREGSWVGFNSEFVDPAPWYFRTIESWKSLLLQSGLLLLEVLEPMNPETQLPASIIFVAAKLPVKTSEA